MRRATPIALALAVALAAPSAARADVPDQDTLQAISRLQTKMNEQRAQGALYPAIETGEKVLARTRRAWGKTSIQTLSAMQVLAGLHQTVGAYDRATAIYERVLAITERSRGTEHEATARALQTLAGAYWAQQRYTKAEPLLQRSLEVNAAIHGKDSERYATALQMYGGLLQARHAYSAAEQVFLRICRILEAVHGPKSPRLVGALVSLGWIYSARGDDDRALAVLDKLRGTAGGKETYPGQRATVLSTAATLYRQFGFDDRAVAIGRRVEKLYRERIRELEREHGEDSERIVTPLGSLAALMQQQERWSEAVAVYRRAIDIMSREHGEDSLNAAAWLHSLAVIERQRGRPERAAEHLERLSKIYRDSHGPQMALSADLLLAESYRDMGSYRRARRLFSRLIRTAENAYGADNPRVALYLERMAVTSLAAGHTRRALRELRRALALEEPRISLILAAGTESDNQAYFKHKAHQLDLALTLNTRYAPRSAAASRFGYETVLRRKGRILDAAAGATEALRRELDERGKKLLGALSAARAKLAKLIVAGPETTGGERTYQERVRTLENRVRRLEQKMRARSAKFRAQSKPIEVDAVRRRIPEGAALVEIVAYRPFDPGATGWDMLADHGRYAAYVVGRDRDPVTIDLGDARAIDRAVTALRGALSSPDRGDVKMRARALYDLTWAKIERELGRRRRILLAPDGALNLVPFAALVDANGRYLVRRYTFTYFTSGRDLLRLGARADRRERKRPVVVADPTFDRSAAREPAEIAGPAVRGVRSREFRSTSWKRLPGTAAEAKAVAGELGGAVVLARERATEGALKNLHGPEVLHIATHGFFLPDQEPEEDVDPLAPAGAAPPAGPKSSPSAISGPDAQTPSSGQENPLLRSGLVFAGANALESGREDGVLTALEASGLDLWGTGLVVLSACETGVGRATRGDGVHGLRRALVIAGAESLVMTLWQVDDRATRKLMTGYYRHLDEGRGRTDALRRVQLATLKTDRYRHPYYWASFVPAGDWTPIRE